MRRLAMGLRPLEERLAWRRLFIAFVVYATLCALAAPASASSKSFAEADAAWTRGELDTAQALYEKALGEGGLEPKQVVFAHARIGAVKAALADNDGALSAFRIAVSIDPQFELAADAGPAAERLFAQARGEAARQGGQRLRIRAYVDETIPARRPFLVTTDIPAGYAVLVAHVVVTVENPATGKTWRDQLEAEAGLTFEVAKQMAEPGAQLEIRVHAEDAHSNIWAFDRIVVRVQAGRSDAPSALPIADHPPTSPFLAGSARTEATRGETFDPLSGPWPWLIGGAVVVVGAVVLYAATRPSDQVRVLSPAWH
jgi:tetratricopeptide (TPR) repeat protein